MTCEEQKAITAFIKRVCAPDQPEIDVEADAIIRALLVRNPEAAYRLTKLAMRQDAKLNAVDIQAAEPSMAPLPAKSQGGWLSTMLKRDERREPAKKVIS